MIRDDSPRDVYAMDIPEVCVIIPVHNMRENLENCLTYLRKQTYRQFEIVVVDDVSSDGTKEMIERKFQGVKVICNNKRLGPEASRNRAIEGVNARYIVTLDADAYAEMSCLEELVKAADSDKKIGMCSCKIVNFFNPAFIDNIGHGLYYDFSPIHLGEGEEEKRFNARMEVFGICLAASLIKKEVFDTRGLFDEDYVRNLGDDEWTWRARLGDYKCLFVPTALVYHKRTTSGQLNATGVLLWERNRILSLIKYYPLHMIIASIYYTLKRYTSYLRKGKKQILLHEIIIALLQAWKEVLRLSPKFLRKRKINKQERQAATSKIKKYLKRNWV